MNPTYTEEVVTPATVTITLTKDEAARLEAIIDFATINQLDLNQHLRDCELPEFRNDGSGHQPHSVGTYWQQWHTVLIEGFS